MEIARLLKRFHINSATIKPIIHEETLSSKIFKVESKKENTILKVFFDNNRFKREYFFLTVLEKVISVPRIKNFYAEGDECCILMQYLPGELLSNVEYNKEIAFQMGRLLAAVHDVSCKFYGDIAKNEKLAPVLENGIFILKNYFERSFDECKTVLKISLLDKIEKYFYDSLNNIRQLDGPRVVHRDFKPGNIIVEKGIIIGLIDWEIAKYGFAEEDFTRLERLLWEKNSLTKEKQIFFEGYSSIRKLPNIEEIMPLLRVCEALGALGFAFQRGLHSIVCGNMEYLQKRFGL